MDIFTWKTQLQDTIEMSYGQNVREVNFGDGYTQVAGLGINIHNENKPHSLNNFINRHSMALVLMLLNLFDIRFEHYP